MSTNMDFRLLDSLRISTTTVNPFTLSAVTRQQMPAVFIIATICLSAHVIYALHRYVSYDDGLPIVNRKFALEPRLFSRIRWAFWSDKILDDAYSKVKSSRSVLQIPQLIFAVQRTAISSCPRRCRHHYPPR